MTHLRDKLITAINRVYFSKQRNGSLAEDMADAVLEVMKREKAK